MSEHEPETGNVAPGAPHDSLMSETVSYIVGLGFALVLTAISFWVASTSTIWAGPMRRRGDPIGRSRVSAR